MNAVSSGHLRVVVVSELGVLRDALAAGIATDDRFVVSSVAPDVPRAAARAARDPADVVVMHVDDHDPTDVTRAIATLRTVGRGAAVVILAQRASSVSAREALAAGATGYVLARSPFRSLLRAIASVGAGEPFVDSAAGNEVTRRLRAPAVQKLSRRERDVLMLVGLGHTNAEIAVHLGLSIRTVETHRAHVANKLGSTTRADLVRHAIVGGLIDLEKASTPETARMPGRRPLMGAGERAPNARASD